jgi:hypothetical protein
MVQLLRKKRTIGTRQTDVGLNMTSETSSSNQILGPPDHPTLPPAAVRALEEAAARRAAAQADETPVEINGPKGEEPTRFGDWERKGITSDF